jgi:hypothetical protein
MNDDCITGRPRQRAGVEKAAPALPYTAKDFQLEVLGKLEEVQDLTESFEQSWNNKLEIMQEKRLLKFDSRSLIALGAVALSVAGYVIQDARNTARQESEIATTKARVMGLEQMATTNTESRIRTEVELGELRDEMAEIKLLLVARENASKKIPPRQ